MTIKSVSLTDTGRQRDHNEDFILSNREMNLYLLCDGMGGHLAGEFASKKAAETINQLMGKNRSIIDKYGRDPTVKNRNKVKTLIEQVASKASAVVYEEGQNNSRRRLPCKSGYSGINSGIDINLGISRNLI